MVLRLIGIIIALVVMAFFTGFNLDNRCAVNLLFHTFENVPVFFTIMISFIAGALFSMPFTLLRKKKKDRKGAESAKSGVQNDSNAEEFSKDTMKSSKKPFSGWFHAKSKKNEDPARENLEAEETGGASDESQEGAGESQ